MADRDPPTHGFVDRDDAGRRLGEACAHAGLRDPIVLALPRGGVPVAAHVATRLGAPLALLAVRKIGAPGNPEYGIGAVAEGGARYLDEEIVAMLDLDAAAVEQAVARAGMELEASIDRLRSGARPALHGRTTVLVDDGVATGGTMRAAIRAARMAGADRVVVAVPVAAEITLQVLRDEADQVICALPTRDLRAVGWWYRDFAQVTDEAVLTLLAAAASG